MPEKPANPEAPKATKVQDTGKPKPTERDKRRAEALRANLRRRKVQSRDRKDNRPETDPRD